MRHSIGFAMAAAMLTVAACGGGNENSGGLSAEENQKLDNMAETLDASPDSLVAEDAPVGNGEDSAESGEVMVSDAPDNAE